VTTPDRTFSDARKLADQADQRASLALDACLLAGSVLTSYWQELTSSDIREKGKGDLVTRADVESEAAVSEFLLKHMPDAGIICEEGTAREGNGLVWYLDPLDGTTNFVQKFPVFAVSLGLAELRENAAPDLLCGVVYNPVSGQLFWGAKGKGSYLNTERLTISQKTRFGDAVLATGFPRRHSEELTPYLKEFELIFRNCRAIRRAGAAALDLCWTAQGIFDGFWEHRLSPWDIAAGVVIVREAGGVCSDFTGEEKFLESGNILGAPEAIQREIIELIARAKS
jgi:myo-inositol-1(or 4)-monophosphatase